MKTPTEQIKSIIREHRLVDAADISDLEGMIEDSRLGIKQDCQCGRRITVTFDRHKFEILTKILSWLK